MRFTRRGKTRSKWNPARVPGRGAAARPVTCVTENLECRRLLSAGALDPTFGTGGVNDRLQFAGGFGPPWQTRDVDSRNYKTVVALNQPFVLRLDAAGRPDPTFGQGGLA